MCRISEPVLQNLVLHLRVPAAELPLLLPPPPGSRRAANFYVVRRRRRRREGEEEEEEEEGENVPRRRRRGDTTFTVFPSSGSVIATGLRRAREAPPAVSWLAREVGCDDGGGGGGDGDLLLLQRWEGRVVNSTHIGAVECTSGVSACRAAAAGADKNGARVSLRTQFFPGVLLKWSGSEGAVNLFNNGKFIIVGVRKEEQVREIHHRLCALMRECWTTFTPGTSCAWSAASCSTA
jgi:TATA-box binding protein (TBP) (component of TFIID and TFIIIB)